MSDASLEEFRNDVRSYLDEHLPAELRVGSRKDLNRDLFKKWLGALTARGWLTPEWPTEYGGGGLDRKQAAALRAELKKAKAPLPGQPPRACPLATRRISMAISRTRPSWWASRASSRVACSTTSATTLAATSSTIS